MSWTDRLLEFRIRRVWTHHISPASMALQGRALDVLDRNTDAGAQSWYVTVDPETPHFVEISDVGRALSDMWSAESLPELAAISSKIAGLASRLQEEDTQQIRLSADVYAMY